MAEFYVFEDDNFFAERAVSQIEQFGHSVTRHASSIQQCFELVVNFFEYNEYPDVIVLDGRLLDDKSTPRYIHHHEGEFVEEVIWTRKRFRNVSETILVPKVSSFDIDYSHYLPHAKVLSDIVGSLALPIKLIGNSTAPMTPDIAVSFDAQKNSKRLDKAIQTLFPKNTQN